MDRSDLELVLAVRLHGSLVKAARVLQLAPPVVTKRLSALESHLGVRLFQRTTRRVSPTTEGHALCDRAAELLNRFVALEDELRERQSEPSGPLRIACSFGFGRLWLGPLLAEFQARYPAVRVDLQLSEQLPDLANEGFDAAIWLWHPPAHIAAEWISRKLAANQRVLVASPVYLAAHGTPQTPEDLASHACLVVRENGGDTGQGQRFDHWRLSQEGQARALHLAVQGPLTSNSGEMVRDWCLAGRGIMLRSLWDIAPQLASGQLVRVLPDYAMYDADIHWLAPYRAQMPLRIRLLQDFLAARFREEPWKALSPMSAVSSPHAAA
ncbi:LysR family transcriptional regulator [Limnohabitans sp. B9-3]|uniref:LysR family transcriptional regulator n=1 Tax=Limnohabitans sp. B9-3 TaxID=1100707 RepID=UPI000C1F3DA8|nr:LysR family transcriptional regulator [Limnohabitans sp. B9-3]PIT75267.1 LysR family transcriptional regulator [Limnohabitans sp. B9-3]